MRVLFRKSYKQDIRLFRDRTQAFWYLLFLCIALAAPLFLAGYFLDELSFVYIYAIAGLGLMILTGFSGQVSFGQAAFVAIGAYAHTILLSRYGVPWILSLPLAALITGLVGLAIGRICGRMHGLYLAIATLSIAIVTERLIGGGGDAWPVDDAENAAIIAAMRAAPRMTLSATGAKGGRFSNTWELQGAASAIDSALLGCARLR